MRAKQVYRSHPETANGTGTSGVRSGPRPQHSLHDGLLPRATADLAPQRHKHGGWEKGYLPTDHASRGALFGHGRPLRVWNFHRQGLPRFRGEVNLYPLILSSTAVPCLRNRGLFSILGFRRYAMTRGPNPTITLTQPEPKLDGYWGTLALSVRWWMSGQHIRDLSKPWEGISCK